MKNLISHILKGLSACALLGIFGISAQQTDHKVLVSVPFNFSVSNQHLTAGTYTFTSNTLQSPILIRSKQSGSAILVLAFSAQANKVQNEPKLVFDRYGDQYFLRKIWYAGGTDGRELMISRVEEQLARTMAKPADSVVLVAETKPHKSTR